jgi:hypothetical protein
MSEQPTSAAQSARELQDAIIQRHGGPGALSVADHETVIALVRIGDAMRRADVLDLPKLIAAKTQLEASLPAPVASGSRGAVDASASVWKVLNEVQFGQLLGLVAHVHQGLKFWPEDDNGVRSLIIPPPPEIGDKELHRLAAANDELRADLVDARLVNHDLELKLEDARRALDERNLTKLAEAVAARPVGSPPVRESDEGAAVAPPAGKASPRPSTVTPAENAAAAAERADREAPWQVGYGPGGVASHALLIPAAPWSGAGRFDYGGPGG